MVQKQDTDIILNFNFLLQLVAYQLFVNPFLYCAATPL